MKNKVSRIGILCVAIFTFSVSEMNAQKGEKGQSHERPTFEELLEKMDKDEDGKLSKKETKGPLNDHFAQIDENEDGFITSEEFANAPKPDGKRPPKKD